MAEEFTLQLVPQAEAQELREGEVIRSYLFTRTVLCDGCTALMPLSPAWGLSPELGVKFTIQPELLVPFFEVVAKRQMSPPSVARGKAYCRHCGTTTNEGYLAAEARAGRMGQLQYANVYRNEFIYYYADGRRRQGKSDNLFRVPDNVLAKGFAQRQEFLASKYGYDPMEDPLLKGMGIWDEDEPEAQYAPGIEMLAEMYGCDPGNLLEGIAEYHGWTADAWQEGDD